MRLAVVTIVAAMSWSCTPATDWQGWIYPDAPSLEPAVPLGRFRSLEECRATAREALFVLNRYDTGDYECGRQCERRGDLRGLHVCEETAR